MIAFVELSGEQDDEGAVVPFSVRADRWPRVLVKQQPRIQGAQQPARQDFGREEPRSGRSIGAWRDSNNNSEFRVRRERRPNRRLLMTCVFSLDDAPASSHRRGGSRGDSAWARSRDIVARRKGSQRCSAGSCILASNLDVPVFVIALLDPGIVAVKLVHHIEKVDLQRKCVPFGLWLASAERRPGPGGASDRRSLFRSPGRDPRRQSGALEANEQVFANRPAPASHEPGAEDCTIPAPGARHVALFFQPGRLEQSQPVQVAEINVISERLIARRMQQSRPADRRPAGRARAHRDSSSPTCGALAGASDQLTARRRRATGNAGIRWLELVLSLP